MEGDKAFNFFLISSGKVKIGFWDKLGNEIVTAYLKRGNIFGENIVLGLTHRKEFAQALSNETRLCPVSQMQVEMLMKENRNFTIGMYKFIGYKLQKIERQYQIMLFRNARVRIVEFIKEMIAQGNSSKLANGDILLRNPYSQSEIASLVAVSRPTFNTIFKELERDDLLQWQKGAILVRNKLLLEI